MQTRWASLINPTLAWFDNGKGPITLGANVSLSNLIAPTLNTDLNANNHYIINLLDPVTPQGAATKAYVDASGSAGANTALSNLTLTAINQSLLPNVSGTLDLGSPFFAWASLFITNLYSPAGNPLALNPSAGQSVVVTGDVVPNAPSSFDLGSSSETWNVVFTSTVNNTGVASNLVLEPQSGFNVELDNGAALVPGITSTQDLGTPSLAWNNLYVNFVSYSPATPSDWVSTPPTTIESAIDRMAALLFTLNGGNPIP